MTGEILIHKRLKKLRNESNITQKEFAIKLGIFMGRDSKIATTTVSSWEIGSKKPSYDVLLAIANYYGVTTDYLIGRTSAKTGDSKIYTMDDYIIEIDNNSLQLFNNKPVFLVFNNNDIVNRWGIYNAEKDYFCCANEIIKNSTNIKYFATTPETEPINKDKPKKLTLEALKKLDRVWVEYISSDRNIKTKYTGWYRVSNDKNDLLRNDGFILSMDGFDVFFNAYKEKI